MKKRITIFFLLACAMLLSNNLFAQNVNLTLKVDMQAQIENGSFDPDKQVVRAAGAFQTPTAWDPASAPDMTDADGDFIYEVTYSVAPSTTYEYKFLIGTAWGKDESKNRSIVVGTSDLVVDVVYFNDVEEMTVGTDSIKVVFRVDMTAKIKNDAFDPATDVVRTAGSMQGWSPADAPDMLDPNEDKIYVITYKTAKGTAYEYKHLIGTAWGSDEKNNRTLTTGSADTVLPIVYFNNEIPVEGDTVNVTFQVDMSVKIKEAVFDPANDEIRVSGTFNSWSKASEALTDVDNDSVYTGAYKIVADETYQYKFLINNTDTGYEKDPTRELVLGLNDTTLAVVWFDRDSVVTDKGDGIIEFQVDMSLMEELGLFNPDTDTMQVRGAFNGWNESHPDSTIMSFDAFNPSLWFLQIPFKGMFIDEAMEYKYYAVIDTNGATAKKKSWKDTYERPTQRGGGNWLVKFEGTNDQMASGYYDGVDPEWKIDGGKNLSVTFRVDMSGAATFNKATDKLYWQNQQPSFTASQGWVDSDTMTYVQLTDENNDNIFEGTLEIQEPSFNSFVYTYKWKTAAGEWDGEIDGYAAFSRRVRFIGQDAANSFPINPWVMPIDSFTTKEVKRAADVEVDPYDTYNKIGVVKENNGPVYTYELEQNYPNPFNPSTTIKYSIPKDGLVTMKIYNILGQEIATLVNLEQKAGSYSVKFDASHFASGVYIYSIKAGNFVSNKKMMFLK